MLENRFLHSALQDQNFALNDELDEMKEDDERIQREQNGHLERIENVLAHESSLAMVFQPIVDVTDHSIVGVEALSRFAGKPMRSPDLWFEEAASVGLGPTLEMKAISAALAQAGRLPDEAFLAVNVSPELLLSGKLDYLADDPICPRLVFELTEHVVVDDYGPIRSRIARFREHGARIAIDDTGAGFSSMRHILLLQPEIIKLDQSLTHGVDHDPARRALASSLVSFAKDIGSDLIAEGVETRGRVADAGTPRRPVGSGFSHRPTRAAARLGQLASLPRSVPSSGFAIRRNTSAPKAAATRHAPAPSTRPQRAPKYSLTAPAIGPPIGVEPMNATAHSAITRPRICGAAASCSELLPFDRNDTLAAPTASIATSSSGRFGAADARSRTTPKTADDVTIARTPVRPRAAV